VARYRFELEQGDSEYAELGQPPRAGEVLQIAGMAAVVKGFVPVTPVYQEAAGHKGIVVCKALDPRLGKVQER
jgi:hypothetical protein